MFYLIAANLLVILHLGFVCFLILGGFLVLKWKRTLYLHIPAAVWGALIEFQGWMCPLTSLEQQLRKMGYQSGYSGGFIEHYILPLLYPSFLTSDIQVVLGTFVIIINILIYGWVIMQLIRRKKGIS